jgi:hypothetical protein
MIDFINGDKFRGMTGLRIEYRDTHDYWNILNYIVKARKDPAHVYKLITHNSDWSVGKAMAGMGIVPEEIPQNLKWFAQNVDIEHPNIESIPIGLENPQWHPMVHKTQKISYCMKYNTKYYTNMCMSQFNPSTNPRRQDIFDHFSQFDWCLSKNTVNGSGFDQYLTDLNSSVFCVCPDGNGIDTHRLWEALYVGCIPIVEDSINARFYEKLPIYICQNFLDIDLDILSDVKKGIEDRLYSECDMTMLSMDYWRAKIYDLS